MAKNPLAFKCSGCESRFPKWMGRCPDCGAWHTVQEDLAAYGRGVLPLRRGDGAASGPAAVELSQVRGETGEARRVSAGFAEVDRVLGGGLPQDAVVLLGGDPGIGKSTLALHMLEALAAAGEKVLYVSGEESTAQIHERAERLGLKGAGVRVLADVELERVLAEVNHQAPRLTVVDSIQTLRGMELDAAAGSVSQVRHCTARLIECAKTGHGAVVLVGHVTKDGAIAGPRALEHMVDVVLYLEGRDERPQRILRSVKNRFGSVHEIGVFRMTAGGLAEVSDPGAHFLAERAGDVTGTVVFMGMEGTRPLPIEIQALVGAHASPHPQRNAVGLENNRVSMLQAVIEKHLGAQMSGLDIYLNVVSGLRLGDPAADSAVVAAMLSSFHNRPIPGSVVVFGEIGLTGELRGPPYAGERLAEAARLGFSRAVVAAPGGGNAGDGAGGGGWRPVPSMRIDTVRHISEFAEALFDT